MLNRADLMALVRLITLATGNGAGKHIIEPSTGFKGDVIADGYLNDLLVRNAAIFNNKDGIAEVVEEINKWTKSIAVLREQQYQSASGSGMVGVMRTIFGIELNEDAILWFTRYSPTPVELFDFTTLNENSVSSQGTLAASEVVSPMAFRSALLQDDNATESVEVDELDWFGKVSEISPDKKAWLLVQLNASFTRIGRQDLFSELIAKLEA